MDTFTVRWLPSSEPATASAIPASNSACSCSRLINSIQDEEDVPRNVQDDDITSEVVVAIATIKTTQHGRDDASRAAASRVAPCKIVHDEAKTVPSFWL